MGKAPMWTLPGFRKRGARRGDLLPPFESPVTTWGPGRPGLGAFRRASGPRERGRGAASPPPLGGTGFGGRHFRASPSSPRFSSNPQFP